MASIKFEIGFNFDSEAGWKIIPYGLQTNTNGFEYYWCFEHEVNQDTDIDTIGQYIDGYIEFLNYSFRPVRIPHSRHGFHRHRYYGLA